MKDNLILVLLSVITASTGGDLLDNYKPQAAGFIQEGRFVPDEPNIVSSNSVSEEVNWTEPGPTSQIVDVNGIGPPPQDDYPRTPHEIREIIQKQRVKQYGWLQPPQ